MKERFNNYLLRSSWDLLVLPRVYLWTAFAEERCTGRRKNTQIYMLNSRYLSITAIIKHSHWYFDYSCRQDIVSKCICRDGIRWPTIRRGRVRRAARQWRTICFTKIRSSLRSWQLLRRYQWIMVFGVRRRKRTLRTTVDIRQLS